MTRKEKSKKYKISKSQNIGSPDAETDDILFDVFVDIDNLNEIVSTGSQKSILIGRTGSGKSAIIEYLKHNEKNIEEIAPEEMSLRFLSNSTIIQYFRKLDVNLNLFYKVLWKHVFIVELLKLYFGIQSEQKKKNFFENLRDRLTKNGNKKEPRIERALDYMNSWTTDFWQKTEYRVKSFERKIEENLAMEFGMDLKTFKSKLNGGFSQQDITTIEAKSKAESVIHNSQVEEIIDIIKIMSSDIFVDHNKKFYIVIDDLDKEWIEDEMRYDLIGAMIEVVKDFRKFKGVKIVIALRENLNEIVFSGMKNRGGQREKFKPLFSELSWTSDELKQLIIRRLKVMSENQMDIKNAFYKERKSNNSGIDYVIERSFFRPRDVISFVNHAIENANNRSYFTKDILAKAEPTYSIDRFQALEDEWYENFGKLDGLFEFLRGIDNGFKLKSLNEDQFEQILLDDAVEESLKGELLEAVQGWQKEKFNFASFLKKIMFISYRIGVIGVKKGPKYPIAFYYNKDVLISRNDITHNSRFYVHPSLYSYFKVNTLEQLPEE